MIDKRMTLGELADILEAAAHHDQGLSYHNGRPERRYDTFTGKPYFTNDRTELNIYGTRAYNFYRIIENAKSLADQIRKASAMTSPTPMGE